MPDVVDPGRTAAEEEPAAAQAVSNASKNADPATAGLPRTARRLLSKQLTWRRSVRLIAGFTLVVTLAGGALAWLLDRADFPTLGTGLWWAIQTVTTVGYGDVTPAHTEGRVIATIVMLAGIGFLAVITASITASFIESARERMTQSTEPDLAKSLREINARLARLEANQEQERTRGDR